MLKRFSKIFKYKISWKSVQWEPSYSMRTIRQRDGRPDMTTLIDGLCNLAAKNPVASQHPRSLCMAVRLKLSRIPISCKHVPTRAAPRCLPHTCSHVTGVVIGSCVPQASRGMLRVCIDVKTLCYSRGYWNWWSL